MATVLNQEQSDKHQYADTRSQKSSFIHSQQILFDSRKKHGLLYSAATAAGLFCIPGILGIMGIETQAQSLILKTLPLPFITFLIAIGMYVLNDLVDADLDRTSSKNRPIPSGLVSKKQAWSFILLTNSAAVAIMLLHPSDLIRTILIVQMMLIGILYSLPKIALMKRFVLKNLAISIFYMLCIMLGMSSSYGINLALGSPIVPVHAMAISGIMIFVGSIVNDLGDTKGDRAAGRHTIPIVLGDKNTIKMLALLLLIMPAVSWILGISSFERHNISVISSIGITIVATLALLRMKKISKVTGDSQLMRKQHQKWFPLYLLLHAGIVFGASIPL
jgi:geranylgeranylglycerol-phosphate geranylgeranyltransferase